MASRSRNSARATGARSWADAQGNSIKGQAVIVFADPQNANANVAGLPAAARVVREAALAGLETCFVACPASWAPDEWTIGECRRLAGPMQVRFAPLDECFAPAGQRLVISGEMLPPASTIAGAIAATPGQTLASGLGWAAGANEVRFAAPPLAGPRLRQLSDEIIRATVKPGDGIVSRYLNRPISQAISRRLLRMPGVRPMHATIANAAVAFAMVLAFLLGGEGGLIAGAILFQLASILDGVDGELARATFRSSPNGAALDSGIDAATNIGFIAGVVINVWLSGNAAAANIGGMGLACLAFGMLLLGLRSRAIGAPLSFNAVKHKFNTRPSKLRRWLTWLTMRDFYAFAGAVLILLGHAATGLVMFAVVTAGWLVVVIVTLVRQPS